MKYSLFGKNIKPNCGYCDNLIFTEDGNFCIRNRENNNYKCKQFKYNPLLRVPKADPVMMKFSREEFIL